MASQIYFLKKVLNNLESDPNFSYCSYCYPVSVPTQMFTGDVAGQLIEGIAEDVPVLKPTVNVTQSLKIAVSHEGDHDSEVSFNAEDDAQLVIYAHVRSPQVFMKGFYA